MGVRDNNDSCKTVRTVAMSLNIDDADLDTDITGVEKIPVSDGGLPKAIAVQDLGAYVLNRVLALTSSAKPDTLLSDVVLGSRSGVLTSFKMEKIASLALAGVWNGASVAPISSAKIPIASGATKGEVGVSDLLTFIKDEIGSSVLSLSGLSAVTSISSGDDLLISHSGVSKRIAWSAVLALVHNSLASYISGLTEVTELADANLIPVVYGGAMRNVTVSTFRSMLGTVGLQGEVTVENAVPQWSSGNGILKQGLPVVSTARPQGVASDSALMTENAVRKLAGFVGHVTLDSRSFGSDDVFVIMGHDDPLAVFNVVVRMPDDWDGAGFKPRLIWSPGAGASVGNQVKFKIGVRPLSSGSSVAGDSTAEVEIVSAVTNGIDLIEITAEGGILNSSSTLLMLTLSRDTDYDGGVGGILEGDANVLMLELEYTKSFSREAW